MKHDGQSDSQNANGTLSGSVDDLAAFLRQMIELVDQEVGAIPVLELQFGDIFTRTSVETGENGYLLVTALLPKCDKSRYASVTPASLRDDTEFLWHSDKGRYIVMRRIAVQDLPDERSVMDAILTASDDALALSRSFRT